MRLSRLLVLSCALGACRSASVSREYEGAYPVFEDECPVTWLDDHGRAMCPDSAAEFVFPDLTRLGESDRLGCPADKVGTISASWIEDQGGPILEQLFLSVSGPKDSDLARHAKEMGGDALRIPDRQSVTTFGSESNEERHSVAATVVRFRKPDCRCVTAWASHVWPSDLPADEVRIVGAGSGDSDHQFLVGRILIHGAKPGGRVAIEDLARYLAAEMGGHMIVLDADDTTGAASDPLGLRGNVVRITGSN